MKKYRILHNDPSGRWKAGDIGTELPLNNPDYFVYLDLGDLQTLRSPLPTLAPILSLMERKFHFYKNEVVPLGLSHAEELEFTHGPLRPIGFDDLFEDAKQALLNAGGCEIALYSELSYFTGPTGFWLYNHDFPEERVAMFWNGSHWQRVDFDDFMLLKPDELNFEPPAP